MSLIQNTIDALGEQAAGNIAFANCFAEDGLTKAIFARETASHLLTAANMLKASFGHPLATPIASWETK